MVTRRAAGEPLQYVLGSWSFRELDLWIDGRVLIPRPETEQVVERALLAARALLGTGRVLRIADLGTGSGAIALSLVSELPLGRAEIWATDLSDDALAVARANLAGVGRRGAAVRVVQGEWFAALPADARGTFDLIVSNPPYVADDEVLPPDVARWEPAQALYAGPTGLEAIEHIVREAAQWLAPHGVLVVEIGETQGDAVAALARAAGIRRCHHPPRPRRPRPHPQRAPLTDPSRRSQSRQPTDLTVFATEFGGEARSLRTSSISAATTCERRTARAAL